MLTLMLILMLVAEDVSKLQDNVGQVVDFDGDGLTDLYTCQRGRNYLLRNLGLESFEAACEILGLYYPLEEFPPTETLRAPKADLLDTEAVSFADSEDDGDPARARFDFVVDRGEEEARLVVAPEDLRLVAAESDRIEERTLGGGEGVLGRLATEGLHPAEADLDDLRFLLEPDRDVDPVRASFHHRLMDEEEVAGAPKTLVLGVEFVLPKRLPDAQAHPGENFRFGDAAQTGELDLRDAIAPGDLGQRGRGDEEGSREAEKERREDGPSRASRPSVTMQPAKNLVRPARVGHGVSLPLWLPDGSVPLNRLERCGPRS